MMTSFKKSFYSSLLLTCFLTVFLLLLSMCDFKISTLNVNGARADFKLMDINRIDVMFLQETHSTKDNECDWKRAFNGNQSDFESAH